MSASSSPINSFVLFVCRLSLGATLSTVGYSALFSESHDQKSPVTAEEQMHQIEDLELSRDSLAAVERRVQALSNQILAVLDTEDGLLDEVDFESENVKIARVLAWTFVVGSFLSGIFLIFGVCTRVVSALVVLSGIFLMAVIGLPEEFGLRATDTNQLLLMSSVGIVLIFQGGGSISFDRIIFPSKTIDD